jgi:hypothetical protein
VAAMERWYHRDHAPEIVRRYGPWLSRFECYLPVHAPADAQAYGFYNWRMTEGWWRELPQAGSETDLCFTPPPVWPRVAACFVPPQPTDSFVVGDFLPLEKVGLRWLVLFRYPKGVSRDEGEEWFLRVHAPEVAQQPGLLRFFSYRVVREAGSVPGRWRPDTLPSPAQIQTSWDRVIELWYETFDDWRESVTAATAACSKPGWRTQDKYPFVEPFTDFVSTFILERPNDDFLRDLRAYVP